jgi:hypothetical protein
VLTGRQLGGDGGAEAEVHAAGLFSAQGAAVVVLLALGGAVGLADLPGGGLGLVLRLGRQRAGAASAYLCSLDVGTLEDEGRQLGGDGGAEAEVHAAGLVSAQGAAVVILLALGGTVGLADVPGGGLGLLVNRDSANHRGLWLWDARTFKYERRDDLGDLMLKANFHVRQELVLAQGALVRPSFALRGAERFAGVGELGFHHIDTEGERGRAA